MKAVILAGGLGTRISEESSLRPKPMIEIGGKPILWHIMKTYAHHNITDFIICCGYKGYLIKEYFANYFLHSSDVTINLADNSVVVHEKKAEPWKITLVDTGEYSQTGGRLKRVKKFIGDEIFCMTYGDGLSSVNITELIKFHCSHEGLATVTAVQPPGRFGAISLEANNSIISFYEKPIGDGGWINGGYFVLSPKVFDLIRSDNEIWEGAPLNSLAESGNLFGYKHHGFWRPMDTLRDKNVLEEMWNKGEAPWKVWR